jgi:dual specificity phosphatase 12
MKWMEFFLHDGQLAGKIICPNKKCAAKLGNYDWAGVCCNCKEWVVPVGPKFHSYIDWPADDFFHLKGFCIHRSKVDEIV